MRREELTAEYLRQVLDYDPATGAFTWRTRPSQRTRAGDPAGSIARSGHRVIGIRKTNYMAHRLAWFHVFGEWPQGDIDHVNRNPDDNRIANLRDIDRAGNVQNAVAARSDSVSGIRGVQRHGNKWRADIMTRQKRHYLGLFLTAAEASAAYDEARRRLHHGWVS